MTSLLAPTTLFGIPLALPVSDAHQLEACLVRLWQAQMGSAPVDLDADLAALGRYWDPKARGERLRRELADLDSVDNPDAPFLNDQLRLRVDAHRALVTAEGRIALHALREQILSGDGDQDLVAFSPALVAACQLRALTVYRDWSQARLRDVVRLLQGEGAILLPPVAALIALLLVNRSTAPERALVRPRDRNQLAEIDAALAEALGSFADRIHPTRADRPRNPRHYSLYQGYLLSEAKRRLGHDLVREDDAVCLAEGRADAVLDFLAADLARRRGLWSEDVAAAFDALVASIRGPVGRLALYGSAHEQASATARLRTQLLNAFAAHEAARASKRAAAGSDAGRDRRR